MAVTVSTHYAAQIDALVDQIEHSKMLRDAQVQHSELYNQYQAECTELTHQLEAWKQHAPRLDELDEDIAFRYRELRQADRRANYEARNMAQVSGVCAVLAVLSVLLGTIGVSHWLIPVATLGLVVATAIAGLRVRTVRQQQKSLLAELRNRIDALEKERGDLLSRLRYYA